MYVFLYILDDIPCTFFMWSTLYRWIENPLLQIGQTMFFWLRSTWWISLKCVRAAWVLLNFLWHFKHIDVPSSKSQSPSSFGSCSSYKKSKKKLDLYWWIETQFKNLNSIYYGTTILICIQNWDIGVLEHFLWNSVNSFHVVDKISLDFKSILTNGTYMFLLVAIQLVLFFVVGSSGQLATEALVTFQTHGGAIF